MLCTKTKLADATCKGISWVQPALVDPRGDVSRRECFMSCGPWEQEAAGFKKPDAVVNGLAILLCILGCNNYSNKKVENQAHFNGPLMCCVADVTRHVDCHVSITFHVIAMSAAMLLTTSIYMSSLLSTSSPSQ